MLKHSAPVRFLTDQETVILLANLQLDLEQAIAEMRLLHVGVDAAEVNKRLIDRMTGFR